ncbi:hypothetical protein V8G54_033423 [Vigna mungo]|uniref:Integrase catalytic domain-containing protein n=1 Tax=Vigna mungo TaxID=3915 RepID=A0AAQ3MNX8_VIGMU
MTHTPSSSWRLLDAFYGMSEVKVIPLKAIDESMMCPSTHGKRNKELITVVNGQGIPICDSGNIILDTSIVLKDVLHVPQLANNLISVQKLTKDLNCSDLATGKTILSSKEQSGLYFLKFDDQSNTKIMSQQEISETWAKSQIWLHHQRLGHPSFSLIKIRSDNGTEYVNHEFLNFLSHNGIVHELTCVNTPQQNGVAQRKNRHLLEVTRALLFQMSVPKNYCREVVLTATYLINRLPTRILNGISPIESLLSFVPSSSLLTRRRGRRQIFWQKDERREQPTSTLEQEKLSNPEVRIPEDINEKEVSITEDLPVTLRKGRRSCVKYPISQYVCTNNLSDKHRSFIAAIDATEIPTSIQEAMKLEHWNQAMKEEMNALERNSTWEIVDKPRDKKAVGCRWIFTVKHKADGTIERYKARLVAKVAKMNTVRVILALAASFGWDLYQLDVKNAFFHGNLDEEVYMEIPPGFEVKNEFKMKETSNGFLGIQKSQRDHTLFIKHSSTGKLTLLLVYVDDMIIAGDDEIEKLALKDKLAAQFEMKNLGKLKYFLGIEVAYSKKGIFISQRKYVLDLLKETGKLGCKTSTVPIEQNHKMGCEESVPVEKAKYQRLVGKLIYLSHTRPDIAYAVSVVSQFMHDPRERHMQAIDKILQYLKSSPGNGLLFKREDTLTMKIYTDADYAGSITDRKSTSGYCVFLEDSLVTWRSKKQDRVSRSTLAQGMCEGFRMKIILDYLKVKVENSVQLYCDKKSSMSIAHNPVQHDRTKHIEIDRHFIKDNLDRSFVITIHVPTELQIADIFTKGLSSGRFQDLKPFVVETDALGKGIGAVLMQEGRPAAPYLLGRHFEVHTDQRSLKYLAEQQLMGEEQQKWQLWALTTVQFYEWDKVDHEVQMDEKLREIIQELLRDPNAHKGYKFLHGRLYYRGRIVIPKGSSKIPLILKEFHDTLCEICQRNKYQALTPSGLLQPLSIPTQVWSDVSMDFIGGLPNAGGKDTILVVVDRLTKYAHFIAMSHPYTAKDVAKIFLKEVVRLHGFPSSIVTDRDRTELFKLTETKLQFSSAYHPQTDGQTEVVNRCVETYLRDPPPIIKGDIRLTADRVAMLEELKGQLAKAQNRMKQQADKHRRDVEYNVGDREFGKKNESKTYSAILLGHTKLSKKLASLIHRVFHVSLIKKLVSNDVQTQPLPKCLTEDLKLNVQPAEALAICQNQQGIREVLIKWHQLPECENSWEFLTELQEHFPGFHLEDKVCLDGKRDDTAQQIRPKVKYVYRRRYKRDAVNRNSRGEEIRWEYALQEFSYKGKCL